MSSRSFSSLDNWSVNSVAALMGDFLDEEGGECCFFNLDRFRSNLGVVGDDNTDEDEDKESDDDIDDFFRPKLLLLL